MSNKWSDRANITGRNRAATFDWRHDACIDLLWGESPCWRVPVVPFDGLDFLSWLRPLYLWSLSFCQLPILSGHLAGYSSESKIHVILRVKCISQSDSRELHSSKISPVFELNEEVWIDGNWRRNCYYVILLLCECIPNVPSLPDNEPTHPLPKLNWIS